MTTVVNETIGTTTLVGFGSSVTGVSGIGGIINVTTISNMAFSMPRNGTITALAAYFSTTVPLSLGDTTVTLTAQVYQSTGPDNIFIPIPGAFVNLFPTFSGIVSIGAISTGLVTGLNIGVSAGTRLLMVFSADVTAGTDIAIAITGFASAGLTIL